MSKRISDLNEAKASRARNTAQLPDPQKPRLADRLVTLAPLARAPLVAEAEPEPERGELSRLSDAPRFGHRGDADGASSRNALVPHRPPALPRLQDPARLSRISEVPPVDVALDDGTPGLNSRTIAGFLIGLSIASAIGFALYAYLA